MYTVTFYSFKGGVGRTLALVNVGVELAKSGRRVLLVDFDLEAPGIDTFDLPKPRIPVPGIVEYVTKYLATSDLPDVREHVYECPGVGAKGGGLWIMPSGNPDATYGRSLAGINWQALYAEHDGFLLFEDLKEQWKELFQFDYVLIDSRTGHTDIEGICTRQLPDAVVLLFFPNGQNLRGLKKVVSDIHQEQRDIRLHFVMSNVPDLDDEDQILAAQMRAFKESLGYEDLSAIIHRYERLELLNQAIFTIEHPHSRLAREYRELASTITEGNPQDREGVLSFLRSIERPNSRFRFRREPTLLDEKLREIRKAHPRDGEILMRVATLRKRTGALEDALELLDAAWNAGLRTPDLLLERAECKQLCADRQGASSDIKEALTFGNLPALRLNYALRLLGRVDPRALRVVNDTPAIRALDRAERLWIAHELLWTQEGLFAADAILSHLIADPASDEQERRSATVSRQLCLIGMGEYRRVMDIITQQRSSLKTSTSIEDVFNYAMAEWAETRAVPSDLFRRVLELAQDTPDDRLGPNRLQCYAVSAWAARDDQRAEQQLYRARQKIMGQPGPEFSCWRYLMASPTDFLEDLNELMKMIKGENVQPMFMRRTPLLSDSSARVA